MLIEYGYLYEPQFMNANLRGPVLKDLALQTYLGLEDFFNSKSKNLEQKDTVILPYTWTGALAENNMVTMDAYALQTALMVEGLYPPQGKTKNDCPRTGRIGSCTLTAIKSFQNKYNITGENGAGQKTIEKLNQLYSAK
jgi:hypothetical protein